jgi:hypothetical protein
MQPEQCKNLAEWERIAVYGCALSFEMSVQACARHHLQVGIDVGIIVYAKKA